MRTSQRAPAEAVTRTLTGLPWTAGGGRKVIPRGSAPLPQGMPHFRLMAGLVRWALPVPMQLSQNTRLGLAVTVNLRGAVPVLALTTMMYTTSPWPSQDAATGNGAKFAAPAPVLTGPMA